MNRNIIISILLGVVVIVAVALGIVFITKAPVPQAPAPTVSFSEKLKSFPVFSQPITADTIGFATISQDGKYFAYSTYTEGATPANQGHVVDLETGEDKALGAMLSRGFKNDNLLPLFRSNGFSLYDASTKQEMFISSSEYVNDAFIAPDNTLVATNGGGFMIKNVRTGETKTLDTKPESSGWAWFSDSKRIVGFKENSENLYEAGHGRDLGIWNVETGTFTKIPVTFKVKTLRHAEWLVPDHVARINAGYDDGSHDYLINLDTNKVTDLGETSWALYGGLVVDQKLGLMAALASGGAGDCSAGECSAFIVDASGAITRITLPRDRHRSSLQIVSPTQLLYISRDLGEEGGYGTTYVTRYDVSTKQETRLQEVPDMNTVTLSLAPDKKTWIVGAGKQFIVGEL